MRVPLPRLSFAAAVGVVYRVHRQTPHRGANAQPAALARLSDADDLVLDVAQLPDGGAALDEDLANRPRGKPHLGVGALLGHQLPPGASGANQLTAAAGF